jgi:hypothetical protein
MDTPMATSAFLGAATCSTMFDVIFSFRLGISDEALAWSSYHPMALQLTRLLLPARSRTARS